MRLIDADKLKEKFVGYDAENWIQISMDRYALKAIDEAPTVDAVPVVRCKDCKNKEDCQWYYYSGREDGFCAWAERKEDDETD